MSVNEEISKFDLEKDSIEDIEKYFSKSILGHSRPTMNISPEGLFRARIINKVAKSDLETTSCIWFPDWAQIPKEYHKLNRCSDKGQNILYCSNYLGTTIKELNPSDNDLILVGSFTLKAPEIKIPCQFAGIDALKRNNQISLLKDYNYQTKRDEEIEKFISEKFQEKVKIGDENKYKLTIAFSNILLKNNDIGCLIYPSVASNLEYTNFGIKPEFVDHLLFCKTLHIFKVTKTDTSYILIPERYAVKVFPNNEILKESKIEWIDNSEEDKKLTLKYSL